MGLTAGADRVGGGEEMHRLVVRFERELGHSYAIQVTTAVTQDGGLSSSTLSEARSWGKVKADADTAMAWVEPSGRGIVHAVSIVNRSADKGGPYNVVLVDLEEGPRMMSRVDGMAHDAVRIGLPVEQRALARAHGIAAIAHRAAGAGARGQRCERRALRGVRCGSRLRGRAMSAGGIRGCALECKQEATSADQRETLDVILRAADRAVSATGLAGIAVAPIPTNGLGEAINDRLARAAAPKNQRGFRNRNAN